MHKYQQFFLRMKYFNNSFAVVCVFLDPKEPKRFLPLGVFRPVSLMTQTRPETRLARAQRQDAEMTGPWCPFLLALRAERRSQPTFHCSY